MGKRLAIKGHPTRSEEVIKLLEMMGGKNFGNIGNDDELFYYIDDKNNIDFDCTIWDINDSYTVFTLEEFLEKYPFKVGDFVRIPEYESEVRILKMKWCPVSEHIEYLVCPNDEEEWFTADELLEDNDNPTKMRDCKKCGLHFGSVRCFDKDCPHNAPKSYAVGLKDGKVIECGVNKEIVMNEIKPLFKAGDVVKLKGDPDENLFWIVIDVVKDGYIFNDAKKIPFDEQHHYEKTNREVIDIQPSKMKNVLAELLEHIKTTPKEELEREFEEIKEWSNVGPTVEEFMTFCESVNKKPKYPTTYVESCEVLFENASYSEFTFVPAKVCNSYYRGDFITELPFEIIPYEREIRILYKLLVCRNAYWKIAGEEMGLDKPWKPDWSSFSEGSYPTITKCNGRIVKTSIYTHDCLLAFPTEEMRNVFYENFKDLIEQCKELL